VLCDSECGMRCVFVWDDWPARWVSLDLSGYLVATQTHLRPSCPRAETGTRYPTARWSLPGLQGTERVNEQTDRRTD
jgi:hypothetical protein